MIDSLEKYIRGAQKNVRRSDSSENSKRALRRLQDGWRDKKNAECFEGSEKCRIFGGLKRYLFISSYETII